MNENEIIKIIENTIKKFLINEKIEKNNISIKEIKFLKNENLFITYLYIINKENEKKIYNENELKKIENLFKEIFYNENELKEINYKIYFLNY